MNTLFYVFIILFVVIELILITQAYKVVSVTFRLKNFIDEKKRLEKEGIAFIESDEYKSTLFKSVTIIVIGIVEWIFMFIGLMSVHSWIIFLFLAVVPFALGFIKISNVIVKTGYTISLKALKIFLMVFALLNSFHFHYDIYKLIYPYIEPFIS